MNKRTFDFIFIFLSAVILLIMYKYTSIEKYMAFSLLPIVAAYFIGQYSERKYRKKLKE